MRCRGLSLIEMLISVAILASGILMVLSVLPRTYAALRQTQEYAVGGQLCARTVEHYRRTPFPTLQRILAAGESSTQKVFAMLNGNVRWLELTCQLKPIQAWVPTADLDKMKLSTWDVSKDTAAFCVTVSWTGYASGARSYPRQLSLTSQVRR